MKLSQQHKDTINLILRSRDIGDGWRICDSKVYEILIEPMPDELVEKDKTTLRVRLTPAGRIIADWVC